MHYIQAVAAVERIAAQRGFEAAEEYIRDIPETIATEEQKSAMWLLAWSYVDRHRQRRVAYEALADVGPMPVLS